MYAEIYHRCPPKGLALNNTKLHNSLRDGIKKPLPCIKLTLSLTTANNNVLQMNIRNIFFKLRFIFASDLKKSESYMNKPDIIKKQGTAQRVIGFIQSLYIQFVCKKTTKTAHRHFSMSIE